VRVDNLLVGWEHGDGVDWGSSRQRQRHGADVYNLCGA